MKNHSFKSILFSAVLAVSLNLFAQPMIPGMSSDCDVKGKYNFTGSMVMKMKTAAPDMDATNMIMNMAVNGDDKTMGMQMNSEENPMLNGMNIIMDLKDSMVLMLMDFGGTKKGMCMDMNSKEFTKQAEKQKKDQPDFGKFVKTGATKKILGYNCEEFKYNTEESTMSMWITNEIENLMKDFDLSNTPGGIQLPEGMTGQWLGMTQFNKELEMTIEAEVTEINKDKPSEISTEGYNFK